MPRCPRPVGAQGWLRVGCAAPGVGRKGPGSDVCRGSVALRCRGGKMGLCNLLPRTGRCYVTGRSCTGVPRARGRCAWRTETGLCPAVAAREPAWNSAVKHLVTLHLSPQKPCSCGNCTPAASLRSILHGAQRVGAVCAGLPCPRGPAARLRVGCPWPCGPLCGGGGPGHTGGCWPEMAPVLTVGCQAGGCSGVVFLVFLKS